MKSSTFLILVCTLFFFVSKESVAQIAPVEILHQSESKLNALHVLQAKCNTCHKVRNPSKVFTIDNMDDLGSKIYHQIFVFKRMPKGKKKKGKDDFSRTIGYKILAKRNRKY